jgi:hypothetical protein
LNPDKDVELRAQLEARAVNISTALKQSLPKNVGFALVLFDFGVEGSLAYTGTGDRTDTITMLETLLEHLKYEDFPKKIVSDADAARLLARCIVEHGIRMNHELIVRGGHPVLTLAHERRLVAEYGQVALVAYYSPEDPELPVEMRMMLSKLADQ